MYVCMCACNLFAILWVEDANWICRKYDFLCMCLRACKLAPSPAKRSVNTHTLTAAKITGSHFVPFAPLCYPLHFIAALLTISRRFIVWNCQSNRFVIFHHERLEWDLESKQWSPTMFRLQFYFDFNYLN